MGYLNRNLEKEEKVVGEEDNGEYFVLREGEAGENFSWNYEESKGYPDLQ